MIWKDLLDFNGVQNTEDKIKMKWHLSQGIWSTFNQNGTAAMSIENVKTNICKYLDS